MVKVITCTRWEAAAASFFLLVYMRRRLEEDEDSSSEEGNLARPNLATSLAS